MAVQASNLAERLLARFETLIQSKFRDGVNAPAFDSTRCPHCDAIVPEIRPVPFEYCPYCEASLESLLTDERQQSGPLAGFVSSFFPAPLSDSMRPVRAEARRQ